MVSFSPSPSPSPLECPPHLPTPCPRRSGSRKQDQEAGLEERFHTRQIIYSGILSARRCFGYIYIFTFSSVTHGFSVWLRNGRGGWMKRVTGVGGGDRWPGTAPRGPEGPARVPSLPVQKPSVAPHCPLHKVQAPACGRGPAHSTTVFCATGSRCPTHLSKGSPTSSATRRWCHPDITSPLTSRQRFLPCKMGPLLTTLPSCRAD